MAVFFGIELGVRINGRLQFLERFLRYLPILIMRHRIATKKLDSQNTGQISGELIYIIHRDNLDQLQIRQHGLHIGNEPTIVMQE